MCWQETMALRWPSYKANDGDSGSAYYTAVTLPDGNFLVAGWEASDTGSDLDFLAIKIDPSDGSFIWKWKDGSSSHDLVAGAAAGADGSVVLAGYTLGNWSGGLQGQEDYAGVKLDNNGSEIWRLQGGSAGDDIFKDVAVGQDGLAVFGGYCSDNFFLMKVDDNGETIWEWSGNSSGEDRGYAVAMPGDNDSVVLAGMTSGDWSGTSAGLYDHAAVKLDSDGNEVWRWQEGNQGYDGIFSMVATEDGSIIMSGETFGSTADDEGGGTPLGLVDVVAFKLHTNGTELWKWQGGTVSNEGARGSALADDGSLIIGGYTLGNWSAIHQGGDDMMVATLNASNGSLLSWRWQEGTSGGDWSSSIATGASSEWVAIVGNTHGSFARDNSDEYIEGAIVMFTSSPAPTPSPFRLATPMPTLAPTPGGISPMARSMPSFSTESPAESDSSSSMLVISVVVPIASFVALLALVSCRRQILVHLRRQHSRNSAGELVEGNGGQAVISRVIHLGRGRRSGGVLRGNSSRGSSRAQEGPDVIPDSNDFHSQQRERSSTSYSQEVPATVMYQSRSAAAPADLPAYDDVIQLGTTPSGHGGDILVAPSQQSATTAVTQSRSAHKVDMPPGYDDMMQRGTRRLSSSYVLNEGNTGSTATNRTDASPKGIPDDAGSESSVGTEPFTGSSAAAFSKSGTTSPAVDTALQLQASTIQGSTAINMTHASSEAESGDSGGALADFNTTNESQPESSSGPEVGVGQAVLETARELAQASVIPALSEAAAMISVLVRLVSDNKQNDSSADGKLRWCRTIVTLLGRAAYILGEGEGLPDEVERGLLEDVRESIDDLVQLIQIYQSKNKLVRVITSSLFKRRQEELESAINGALSHLQVGLQLHGGLKLNAVRQDVKDALLVQQQQQQEQQSPQRSISNDAGQPRPESRRRRRQRQLEQLEISEEQLTLTDELLGKGGFGSVYMADCNGRNAAAKVLAIEHDLVDSEPSGSSHGLSRGDSSTRSLGLQKDQRRAFFRELDAMRRLRSPYTVNLYGAVTSRRDRLILVMELMSGGDLRKFLKGASGPIEEERARRIVGEVCAGMAFLHDKQTMHGDLKSANVLFDGYGRAKICDFGTSQWAQHAGSTELATYTSGVNKGTPMSLPWTAPEVLNKGERSFMSDVYSFGMVTWEVLTRKIPWADQTEAMEIFRRVVFKDERPSIPDGAPSDLVEIVRSCWITEPSKRPSFQKLLRDMKSNGWKEV